MGHITKIFIIISLRLHSKFNNLIKYISFTWELETFAVIFVCGMIILLERTHYVLGIGSIAGGLFFLLICFVNEKIIEKVGKDNVKLSNKAQSFKYYFYLHFSQQIALISNAIYDLPWYALKPKERRMIFMLMNFNEMNLTAADFHSVTFERLTTVYNAAQSNCLILKNLAVNDS